MISLHSYLLYTYEQHIFIDEIQVYSRRHTQLSSTRAHSGGQPSIFCLALFPRPDYELYGGCLIRCWNNLFFPSTRTHLRFCGVHHAHCFCPVFLWSSSCSLFLSCVFVESIMLIVSVLCFCGVHHAHCFYLCIVYVFLTSYCVLCMFV